jgi:hypothetical protein
MTDVGSLAYWEWSAPEGSDIEDRAAVAAANPAWGTRLNEEYVFGVERGVMDEEEFARERLGIFPLPDEDPSDNGPAWLLIPEDTWSARGGGQQGPGWLADPVTFAVEMPLDRSSVSISVAGQVGERIGVDLVERRDGTSWAAGFIAGLVADEVHEIATVVIDEASPAGKSDLPRDLEALDVPVLLVKFAEVKEAVGGMLDALRSDSVQHRDDPILTAAAADAHPRFAGDALLVDRKASDAAPFIAACLARWGHLQGQETESIYESRGVVVL